MSDFNIRDYRNAHMAQEEEAETSNKTFWSCIIAIPVIAAIAGVGWQPLMDMRSQNSAALQQAQVNAETAQRERLRASNPALALMADLKDGKTVDLNQKAPISPAARARADYAKRSLSANEFMHRVDAKASGFTKPQMEMLKYTRTQWAMTTCGHYDLRKFYTRNNEAKYKRYKDPADNARQARVDAGNAKVRSAQSELKGIKTEGDAMKFVLSGGAMRHQQKMMSGMGAMMSSMGNYEITSRRQRFNKTGCMQVRTIIQSGAMNLR